MSTKKAATVATPEAPSGLSERSLTLWRAVVPKTVASPGGLIMVEQALRALDRADQAARAVEIEGLTSVTPATGAIHVHPAVKVERENRALFARLWSQMRLEVDWEFDKDRGW